MKYILAALISAGLIGGIVTANESGSGVLSHNCPPSCPSQGPQEQGAGKGDRQQIHDYPIPRTQKESSNSESHEHDTSTEKRWPPVVY